MLYVRGNNYNTDDAEYYVNHLMVAVLRELDGDTLYCIIVQSRITMAASWRDVAGGTVSEKYKIGVLLG